MERVKRCIMCQTKETGGLDMMDMRHLQYALCIKWITLFEQSQNNPVVSTASYYYSKIFKNWKNIVGCSVDYKEFKGKVNMPSFYSNLLRIFLHLKKIESDNIHYTV